MSHTYKSILIHYVFSTKNREKIISQEIENRLWKYINGIANNNDMKILAIGGIEDHVHILIVLPTTLSIAKAIQLIKGGSSKWIHDTFKHLQHFNWQSGYGAFSVSISQVETTIKYINSQKKHHKTKTFQEEYIACLKKHNLEYDEQYIWC